MQTGGTVDDGRHLSYFQSKRDDGKLFLHGLVLKRAEIAAPLEAVAIALRLGQLFKLAPRRALCLVGRGVAQQRALVLGDDFSGLFFRARD